MHSKVPIRGSSPAIKAARNEPANCRHSCSRDAVRICESPAETGNLIPLHHEKYNSADVCDFVTTDRNPDSLFEIMRKVYTINILRICVRGWVDIRNNLTTFKV